MKCHVWADYISPIFSLFYKNIWGLLTFLSYFDWYSKLHPEEIKHRKHELKQRQRQSKRLHAARRKQFTAKQMVAKNKPFFSSLADVICTNSLLESNYQTHQYNKSICKTLHLFFSTTSVRGLVNSSSRHLFQQSPIAFLYAPAISVYRTVDFRKRRAFDDS